MSSSAIKEETKNKFDSLLKKALNSKDAKESENLKAGRLKMYENKQKKLSENDVNTNKIEGEKSHKIVKVDVHTNSNKNDNFILQKFLNETNDNESKNLMNEDESLRIVKKSSSNSSNETYRIERVNGESDLSNKNSKLEVQNNDLVSNFQDSINLDSNSDLSLKLSKKLYKSSRNSENTSISVDLSEAPKSEISYESEVKTKNRVLKEKSEVASDEIKEPSDILESNSRPLYDYKHIIGITVHKTDRLTLNSIVIHPVVKVHIVNSETGAYLRKSDFNRSVVFYYENRDIAYITPIISEPYNLYKKHSLYPAWEETMIINEDINFLLEEENNVVILFELMDFVTFSEANSQFYHRGLSKGWHKIAWAFLKPLGAQGNRNIDKKVRLQLYYPDKLKKNPPHVCDIFHWWSTKKFNKYPSTLYVSVKKIIPPENVIETFRSKTPIHKEVSCTQIFENNLNLAQSGDYMRKESNCSNESKEECDKKIGQKLWSKLRCQTCKLPNKCMVELSSYEEGCLMMKFSNNGLYLACSVLIKNISSLVIFSVETFEEVCKLSGHQGLIYDISWSPDDHIIMTASADCTSCVWNFEAHSFIEILPHPSYVYVNQISCKNIIATGCYDHIIRIWCYKTYNLLCELEEHEGYITSLCFNKKSNGLYSSDSVGVILLWKLNEESGIWNLKREFKLIDLRSTIIDQLMLYKGERRLLINTRESINSMDIKSGFILYKLNNSLDKRIKTVCDFSYCGSYLFSSSENGTVNIWNSAIGEKIGTYKPYHAFGCSKLSINCIKFHPFDNIMVVSNYGRNIPILLISHDHSLKENFENNIGLTLINGKGDGEKKNSPKSIKKYVDGSGTTFSNGDKEEREKIEFKVVIQKIDDIVRKPFGNDIDGIK